MLESLVPSEGEVDRIFDHPLEAILDPSLASKENLALKGSEDWTYKEDYHVCLPSPDVSGIKAHLSSVHFRHRFAWVGQQYL